MASDFSTLEAIIDQSGLGPRLTHRRMFGEFALYIDGKVVAFICDNQLLVKPTEPGRALEPALPEGHIYPDSKLHIAADELLDDRHRLNRLLLVTFDALPWPKPKAVKKAVVKKAAVKKAAAKKAAAKKVAAKKAPAGTSAAKSPALR